MKITKQLQLLTFCSLKWIKFTKFIIINFFFIKVGEVMGGSQREERLEVLDQKIKDFNLEIDNYWWYRDLRKYGTIPHSGFGVGFERLIMIATGVDNIREVIPYPRYPGNADF